MDGCVLGHQALIFPARPHVIYPVYALSWVKFFIVANFYFFDGCFYLSRGSGDSVSYKES